MDICSPKFNSSTRVALTVPAPSSENEEASSDKDKIRGADAQSILFFEKKKTWRCFPDVATRFVAASPQIGRSSMAMVQAGAMTYLSVSRWLWLREPRWRDASFTRTLCFPLSERKVRKRQGIFALVAAGTIANMW